MIQRLRRTTRSICTAWVPAEGRTEPIEVSIGLISDAEIQELNATWRGKDQPTDVLSFAQFDPPFPVWAPTLGDVVISLETAQRQANTAGHSLSDELVVLLTHGLLHLLGLDHQNAKERAEMAAAEDAILQVRGLRSGLVGRAG
jgi:probable rRNA maturation factor